MTVMPKVSIFIKKLSYHHVLPHKIKRSQIALQCTILPDGVSKILIFFSFFFYQNRKKTTTKQNSKNKKQQQQQHRHTDKRSVRRGETKHVMGMAWKMFVGYKKERSFSKICSLLVLSPLANLEMPYTAVS